MKKNRFLLLFFLLLFEQTFSQTSLIDSLENALNRVKNDAQRMKTLDLLAVEYFYEDINKLEGCANEMLELAIKLKKPRQEGTALIHIGNYHYSKGNYEPALKAYNQAIQIQKKGNFQIDLANTYLNIGNVYESMGNTEKALQNYLGALKIDEKIGDKPRLSDDYTNLGIFYAHLGDFKLAEQYYNRALNIDLKSGDERRLSEDYLNFGSFYYSSGNIAKSLDYHQKALILAEKINYTSMLGKVTNNLSELYMETKDYPKALESLYKSLKIKEEIGHQEGLVNTYLNLGTVYKLQGKYSEALQNANLSKKMAGEMKFKEGIRDAALVLSEIYNLTGDYKRGFESYKEYSDIRHALINDESVKQLAEMRTKYDTEKKDQQIKLLNEEDTNKKLKIKSQRAQIFVLIISALLVIALILILYMRYRQKQKRLMAQQLLEEQALRFSSIVEAQENEKIRIARDLHDGVCQKFAATKMKFSNLNEDIFLKLPDKSDKYKDCIRLLDEATSELRTVTHEIMPPALRQHDLPEALKFLAEETFDSNIVCTFESFGKLKDLSSSVEINVYRIAQELFANVIKHSEATEVAVQLMGSAGRVSLMVEDNGKGLDTTKKVAGVGLSNIELRTQMLNGKFNMEPAPNGGTIATLNIEIKNLPQAKNYELN